MAALFSGEGYSSNGFALIDLLSLQELSDNLFEDCSQLREVDPIRVSTAIRSTPLASNVINERFVIDVNDDVGLAAAANNLDGFRRFIVGAIEKLFEVFADRFAVILLVMFAVVEVSLGNSWQFAPLALRLMACHCQ